MTKKQRLITCMSQVFYHEEQGRRSSYASTPCSPICTMNKQSTHNINSPFNTAISSSTRFQFSVTLQMSHDVLHAILVVLTGSWF